MSSLTDALGQVSNLRDQLDGLLEQLKKMRGKLKGHEPAHVIPAHVEKQIKELMVCVDILHTLYLSDLSTLCTCCLFVCVCVCVCVCSYWTRHMVSLLQLSASAGRREETLHQLAVDQ